MQVTREGQQRGGHTRNQGIKDLRADVLKIGSVITDPSVDPPAQWRVNDRNVSNSRGCILRFLISLAALMASTTAVMAACPTAPTLNTDKVGKELWVVQYDGDYPTVPRLASEHYGFQVRPQVQTGPERWEGDRDREPIMLGTTGSVVSIAGHINGSPRWFNVQLDDGREVVLDSLQFVVFDYTTCAPATLLENRSDDRQYARQWVYYLPLKLKEGVRPVNSLGDWIDQKYLDALQILDCTSFDYYEAAHPDQFDCVPVWRDDAGIDMDGYDTPRHFYPTADMVEHATIEDLAN